MGCPKGQIEVSSIRNLRVSVRSEEARLGVALREVATPQKAIETPRRALSLTLTGPSEATANLHPSARGLVEVYRELSPETLSRMSTTPEIQRAFVRELGKQAASISGEEMVLLALALREKGYCPAIREAEYLADLSAAPFVDAVMIPAILPTDRESYFTYAKSFLEAFSRIDKIPLLGYIPNFAYRDVLRTIDFFLAKGIKDFVLEFNGHHAGVLYPNIQGVNRVLRRELGDDFFLHGLNVGPGAFRRSDIASPSKDFLALLSGIDSIGAKHVRKKMPMRVWRRLAAERERGRRLFARGDYGYYEPRAYDRRFRDRAEDGMVSSKTVCRNPTPQNVRLFNAERQAIETAEVRRRLSEGGLLEYVQGKATLREDIDKVASLWSARRGQQTLNM